jgi:ferritin-like protein
MSSENYHEPYEILSTETKDLHRALVSLVEELEAVDWYQQRASACADPELRDTLLHHKNEEIEHAMMNLEWIRRRDPTFDANLRLYLFSEGPITQVEKKVKGEAVETGAKRADGSLGIGSLRGR